MMRWHREELHARRRDLRVDHGRRCSDRAYLHGDRVMLRHGVMCLHRSRNDLSCHGIGSACQ
jgi:hypothetical protein